MRLLHIDSSARASGSSSRELSAFFLEALGHQGFKLEIDYLDLAETPPRHVSELQTSAMYTHEADRTPEMREALRDSEQLCDRVLRADTIVCGIPMYNFGMPSVFKAFVDNIVRVGRTFIPTEGGYEGMLGNARVLLITTRGADWSGPEKDQDHLSPHLKTIFAWLGAGETTLVEVQPLQFAGPDFKATAISKAKTELNDIAARWIPLGDSETN